MRAFVAIELPNAVQTRLSELIRMLRTTPARARWVPVDKIHLTLVFLGRIDPAQAEDFSARLRAVCAPRAPLSIVIEGVGAFPNLRAPTVIWAGIRTNPALNDLQEAAAREAEAIGVPRERRPFQGHLTLARLRDPGAARPLLPALQAARDYKGGAFEAAGVSLFESRLSPAGADYRRVEAFPFEGNAAHADRLSSTWM